MIAHAATTLSMISIIEDHARKRPDRTAVIYNDRRFSYLPESAVFPDGLLRDNQGRRSSGYP